MSVSGRFRGRQTRFYIELLYGLLFIAGFSYLVFRFDPRVAAFAGGLVVGYLLRIWEKMSIYERIIEEAVSEEAEAQVADEVQDQVADEVATEVEDQVTDEVATEVEAQVADEVAHEVEEKVEEHVVDEVEDQVADQVADEVEEQIDERVSEQLEEAEESGSDSRTA